jgi:two-component system sensor histidine kinase BaeS
MYGFMRWSFERGFIRFVEARQQERVDHLVANLADEYLRDDGWQGLRGDKRRWIQVLLAQRSHRRPHRAPWIKDALRDASNTWPPLRPNRPRRRRFQPLALRVMLLDTNRSLIFGNPNQVDRLALNPIRVAGQTVGYLGVLPGPHLGEIGEIRFLQQQTEAFVIIAILMVAMSAALTLPLAYTLVRPLRRITDASKDLAVGRYGTRIPVHSKDELGQLARDFNDLAHALEQTEKTRRQWVADISHELRTPLSVLRGEIEALQDGVRVLDRAALDSLHGDVMRLSRLVDDLYELSMTDLGALSYQKTSIDPVQVLEDDLGALAGEFAQRGVAVHVDNRLDHRVVLHADADRLSQLYRNLLSNTLRYTEAEGKLEIYISQQQDQLVICFQDSAPAVPESEVSRLFERFYRVETSRSRSLGGAGLGLAICRNIVEAHDGRIGAQASPLGGLSIRIELPLTP